MLHTCYAQKQLNASSGRFAAEKSAGIELYSAANSVGNMNDSKVTNDMKRNEVQSKLANAKDDKEKAQAKEDLKRFDTNDLQFASARAALVNRLEDKQFVSGFGSNGGEEFLSYMSIGEALIGKGGDEWTKWDKSMTENMNRIQNQDGSWTGHH
jgi:hypothetical protein